MELCLTVSRAGKKDRREHDVAEAALFSWSAPPVPQRLFGPVECRRDTEKARCPLRNSSRAWDCLLWDSFLIKF